MLILRVLRSPPPISRARQAPALRPRPSRGHEVRQVRGCILGQIRGRVHRQRGEI